MTEHENRFAAAEDKFNAFDMLIGSGYSNMDELLGKDTSETILEALALAAYVEENKQVLRELVEQVEISQSKRFAIVTADFKPVLEGLVEKLGE